jgi:endo-1,4-beta-xylanase
MERESDPMRHLRLTHLIAVASTLLVAAGVLTACTSHNVETNISVSTSDSSAVNLIHQKWDSTRGVTRGGDALTVDATGFKIVDQDGTGGQDDPSVNYDTRLRASGDFAVTATIADNKGDASVQLYDTLPVIADEFRVEPASIKLTEMGTDLEVRVWDGSAQANITKPKPIFDKHVTLKNTADSLTISRVGDSLQVIEAGKVLAETNQGKLFTSGSVWLGLDSTSGGFKLTKFTATGDKLSTIDTTKLPSATTAGGLQELANAYRPGFKVGAAVALGPFASDPAYTKEFLSNFSMITMENAMKAQFISPKQGVYDFQAADALLAIANKNGIAVHGHNIAFSEAEPAWMRNLPTGTAAERASTSKILMDYLTTVVTHFKGKLTSLDVINEPLDTDDGTSLQANVWSRALGPNWMAQVSQAVYDIDPNVQQYINENGAEAAGDRQDALYDLVTSVNQQGGHIYGVGLQAHVYDTSTDAISATDLNTTINRFGAANLHVRISEMDVTDDSGTATQAKQYADVFITCLKNPNCVSFTTWGVDDRYDRFIDDDGSLQTGHDLLFNNGKPTDAYTAILAAIKALKK